MSEVTRYDLNEDVATGDLFISPVPQSMEGRYVSYEDYAALQQKLDAVLAENVALKASYQAVATREVIVQDWGSER